MPVCFDAAVSLRDPSLTRPGRVAFAAAIYVVALGAAGLAGWGWATSPQGTSDHLTPGIAAIMFGQGGAIVLLIATGFALPPRWRASSIGGPLMLGLAGFEVVALSAGMGVALASSHGSALGVLVMAGLGVALMLAGALLRIRSVSRTSTRDRLVTTGLHVAGVVTDREQTGMVNNVPRWRVVTQFSDASGTTRWVTKHSTTWSPPLIGQEVDVYFDPAHPDHQREIVVSW